MESSLFPFCVIATSLGRAPEQINILSRSSGDAAVQAINLLFSDADDCAAGGFRLVVRPLGVAAERRAA